MNAVLFLGLAAAAAPQDTVRLGPGVHPGPIVVERPTVVLGAPGAVVRGTGRGSVVEIRAPGSVVRGLRIEGSGRDVDRDDCFEAHLQEFWHGSLRPGDAAASTRAVPFLKVCFSKAPKHIARSRIRIRADSGFFGKRVIEFLDGAGCGYVIVAKEYSTIKTRSRECRFKKLRGGWEVAEFRYKPHKWQEPHRFVVVRRPIPQDPVEAQQLTLFKDRKYAYHVLVTNLKTHPWRVWQFYAKRATIEKNIRELLYDYPLGKIPTNDWVANVAFFQISLFAYNLVHWFTRLCLP